MPEVIVSRLATTLGLRVPEHVILHVSPGIPTENRDPELLELIARSGGPNIGVATVPAARDFTLADAAWVREDEASRIVWLDWWVMNPDRTPSNPNLLVRRGQVWLIDHGSALMFHHDWPGVREDTAYRPWHWEPKHVLIDRATDLHEWSSVLAASVTREMIEDAVDAVPDAFLLPLVEGSGPEATARRRAAYVAVLWKRLRAARQGPADAIRSTAGSKG